MEIVYKRKNVSVREVLDNIPDPPSYSAVRSAVKILEKKGLLKYINQGKKNIYSPTVSHGKAAHSAVKQLMTTYFDNSVANALVTILKVHEEDLDNEDLRRLNRIIENARKEDNG